MSTLTPWRAGVMAVAALLTAGVATAHVTPPVVVLTERQALVQMLEGAAKYAVREVRLTEMQRASLANRVGWRPDVDFFRFFIGRDADGQDLATAVFVTDYTMHGPVRVAVAVDSDGRILRAAIMEMTQESYKWIKPLIDDDFPRQYAGLDRTGNFDPQARLRSTDLGSMSRFYAGVIANLIRKGLEAYNVGLGSGGSGGS